MRCFDRRFVETLCPAFAEKPWACSLSGVDWAGEGFEGSKLGYLAMRHGPLRPGWRRAEAPPRTLGNGDSQEIGNNDASFAQRVTDIRVFASGPEARMTHAPAAPSFRIQGPA
jgi:hypothetical protein